MGLFKAIGKGVKAIGGGVTKGVRKASSQIKKNYREAHPKKEAKEPVSSLRSAGAMAVSSGAMSGTSRGDMNRGISKSGDISNIGERMASARESRKPKMGFGSKMKDVRSGLMDSSGHSAAKRKRGY